jgi:hypothetical protein
MCLPPGSAPCVNDADPPQSFGEGDESSLAAMRRVRLDACSCIREAIDEAREADLCAGAGAHRVIGSTTSTWNRSGSSSFSVASTSTTRRFGSLGQCRSLSRAANQAGLRAWEHLVLHRSRAWISHWAHPWTLRGETTRRGDAFGRALTVDVGRDVRLDFRASIISARGCE